MNDALWVGRSANSKTGDVPQMFVGATAEATAASCEGCQLLGTGPWSCPRCYADNEGGKHCEGCGYRRPRCYAKKTPAWGHASIRKAVAGGANRSLKRALAMAARAARMVRLGANGDPGALPVNQLTADIATIRSEGMDAVGFTHLWRDKPELRGLLMASCDTAAQADEALDAGWRVAVVLPKDHQGGSFTTPKGRRGRVCPAQLSKRVDCNSCRLCAAHRRGPPIGFVDSTQ